MGGFLISQIPISFLGGCKKKEVLRTVRLRG